MKLSLNLGTTISRHVANSFLSKTNHPDERNFESTKLAKILLQIRNSIISERFNSDSGDIFSEDKNDYQASYFDENQLENFESLEALHIDNFY